MHWGEEEFVDCCNQAVAHTLIRDLNNEGLVDSIEDENGEEVVWITEKGREVTNRIIGEHNKED
jgi:predicted transcriptional regulator